LTNVGKQRDTGRSMFPMQAAAMAEKRTPAALRARGDSWPIADIESQLAHTGCDAFVPCCA
jgi:hypothetical protein